MRATFQTEFIDTKVPQDSRIEELKYWCVRFHELKLTPLYRGSSLGNLSFRLKYGNNSFIITASELKLKDNLTADMFVTVHSCDLKRGISFASGIKEPSSESVLHYEIYGKRKDVGAIFHGHSDVILSHGDKLNIPATRTEDEPASVALAESVLDILGNESFLIMRNHGFLSLGRDMKEAGEQAVKIYEECNNC